MRSLNSYYEELPFSSYREKEKDTGWNLKGSDLSWRPWSGGTRSELEKKLGKHKFDYFRKVALLETLRRLSIEKRSELDNLPEIDRKKLEKELEIIGSVFKNGANFSDYVSERHHTSSNSLQGGEFYELSLSVNDIKSKVFIKLFPDRKTYRISKLVQERVAKISQNVVAPAYCDDRLRIMAIPFIEGQTLDERLQSLDSQPDLKMHEFERAIDILCDVHIKGTKEKFSDTNLPEITNAANSFLTKFLFATNPEIKKSNTTWLGKTKVKDAPLEDLLKDYKLAIGGVIDNPEGNRLIHGDTHPRNFIVSNELMYLIDFDLARFGKIQLDLFKLFEKSGVLNDEKMKAHLLDYAYENIKHEIPVAKSDFMRVYASTEIHEYFMAVGRYLSFAKDRKLTSEFGKEENLRNTACLYYTRALKGLRNSTPELAALASKIDIYVDVHYKGELHKLSRRDISSLKYLPDNCMLSTILSQGSLNEVALYHKGIKNAKKTRTINTTKRVARIAGTLAAVGLVAYMGITVGTSSNYSRLNGAFDTVQNIQQFMMQKGDQIYGTVLYNDDLDAAVYLNESEKLFKTLGGENNTILSDKEFKKHFMREVKKDGCPGSGLISYFKGDADRERLEPEVLASLMYATLLKTPERTALEAKGRFGKALLSKQNLDKILLSMGTGTEDGIEHFKNDFNNPLFAARALGAYLMQSQGEVYTALAYYLLGVDAVDKARASVDKDVMSNDINQYWEYLPEGPEKSLLQKAIGFYESCKKDKHNKFVQSPAKNRAKDIITKDLLLWEYNEGQTNFRMKKSGEEMMKTPEYQAFLEKYHNKGLALIACYDEGVLKTAIAAASKTHLMNISEFIPESLEAKVVIAQSPQVAEIWMSGYGYKRLD